MTEEKSTMRGQPDRTGNMAFYSETRFRLTGELAERPNEFVILSAYATTGHTWLAQQNVIADRRLEAELRTRGGWLLRIEGYSPSTGHAEPSWATGMTLKEALEVGRNRFNGEVGPVQPSKIVVAQRDVKLSEVAFDCRKLPLE